MRTALKMAGAIRDGEVSPLELVEEALERAASRQPVSNAFSQLHADEALREARLRTEAVSRSETLGPLHGVPVAVKDLFDVAGWETTGCCEAYRGRVAESDSDAVRRLREAGAVVIGKTNQHELAAGATNVISACGPARNPWDPSRMTGGSSGGSAAAVVAGTVPVALGTDTGGSIRIPASFCGVTGLKPTFGAVSLEGVMPLAASLDTAGPLARTLDDVAAVFAVLTGADQPLSSDVAGLTVGALGGFHAAMVHPEVGDAIEAAAGAFEGLGARVVAVVEDLRHGPEVWEEIAWPEFAEAYGHLLERADLLHARTRGFLEQGARQTDEEAERAEAARAEVEDFFMRALSVADALLAPCTPFVAPRIGEDLVDVGDGLLDVRRGAPSRLTRLVNLAGVPSLALPVGFSREGLPIGAQLIGRPGEEAVLLGLGGAFQQTTDHHRREPPI